MEAHRQDLLVAASSALRALLSHFPDRETLEATCADDPKIHHHCPLQHCLSDRDVMAYQDALSALDAAPKVSVEDVAEAIWREEGHEKSAPWDGLPESVAESCRVPARAAMRALGVPDDE